MYSTTDPMVIHRSLMTMSVICLERLSRRHLNQGERKGSALALFATVGVAFVFGHERPCLRGRSEEHLGDLHPVAAVSTGEERLCSSTVNASLSVGGSRDVPSSSRPLKAGARSLMRAGRRSSRPMGM